MLETKHQKKALIETLIVMAIMVALMFISGLKYLDPPPPGNIAINFGTSDTGSGHTQPARPHIQPKPVKRQPEPAKPVKEKILTQKDKSPVTKNLPEKQTVKPAKQPVKKTPKPSKEATRALNDLFNTPKGNNRSKGEGNDRQAGDKGSRNGTEKGNKYFGTGGGTGGGDPNYRLGSRKALTKPRPQYQCNEEGRVVVKIKVNREGRVVDARPSKGTTASKCLTDAAVRAALKTTWEPDPNAPDVQVGKIIYRFKLRE